MYEVKLEDNTLCQKKKKKNINFEHLKHCP